ncbi:hypothetical protein AA309_16770 [Microvirga vignae]|uniref:DUF1761 domain-containing protein n=1 Tax=Microvirga vignae TaxID=1225564 RepID=A0A0H1RA11_9HYPH|nr:DUF1761 domain-containing protein [Microvirga vignae]KLK92070.1 hypothetical protein AA309_16770 [Microvirga vignae]
MTFAGTNFVAILVCAVAGWLFGMVWYMSFGNAWMSAIGKTREDLKPSPGPFIIAFVALLVMGWVLAGVIDHMGQVTIRNGVLSGFFMWLGFVITTLTVNHGFGGQKRRLTLIDGGHWLGVLLVQGAVIGSFGV